MNKERGCSHRKSFTLFLKSSFHLVCYWSKQCSVFCSLSLVLNSCFFHNPFPPPLLQKPTYNPVFVTSTLQAETAGASEFLVTACLSTHLQSKNMTVLSVSSLKTLNLIIQWLLLAKSALKAQRAVLVSSALGFLK
jgi:hypothetical protein